MFYLIFTFILIWCSLYLYLVDSLVESASFTYILMFGLYGLFGFLLNEYFSVKYALVPKYIFFAAILILPIILRRKNLDHLVNTVKNININKFLIVVFIISAIFVWGVNTPVRGWDAYSMYDARAKMFNLGEKMSSMGELTKYDDKNNLYYFSYPPMTSAVHAIVYSVGIKSPMFLYVFLLISLSCLFYSEIKKIKISIFYKLAILVGFIFNPLIFDQITIAYSNLPAIAFQMASILLILKYIQNKNATYILFSGLFLGFTNWTRSLEPTFIAILVAFGFVLFKTNGVKFFKKSILFIVLLILSVVPRQLWFSFVVTNVGNTGATMPSLSQLTSGLIDSASISNIISVIFFIYTSLLDIKIYMMIFGITIFVMLLTRKMVKSIKFQFIGLILFSIILVMSFGTLYFSQVFTWWNEISGSFLRSNLILLPLIGIYSGYFIEYFDDRDHNDVTNK